MVSSCHATTVIGVVLHPHYRRGYSGAFDPPNICHIRAFLNHCKHPTEPPTLFASDVCSILLFLSVGCWVGHTVLASTIDCEEGESLRKPTTTSILSRTARPLALIRSLSRGILSLSPPVKSGVAVSIFILNCFVTASRRFRAESHSMFLSQLNIYLPCVVLVPPATREELHDGLHDGHASTYHICARSRLHDWLRRMALHTGKGQNRLFSIHSESNGTCAVDGPSLQSRRRSSLPPCALLRILCILCRLRVYLNSLEPTGNGDIRSATA